MDVASSKITKTRPVKVRPVATEHRSHSTKKELQNETQQTRLQNNISTADAVATLDYYGSGVNVDCLIGFTDINIMKNLFKYPLSYINLNMAFLHISCIYNFSIEYAENIQYISIYINIVVENHIL